jgi:DNA-binding phage protein
MTDRSGRIGHHLKSQRRAPEKERVLELQAELREHVASKLESLMAQCGMTIGDVAKELVVSRTYLYRMLSERQNFTLHTLARVGEAIGYRFELRAVLLSERRG